MDSIKKEVLEIKEKMESVQDTRQRGTRSIPAAASSSRSSSTKNNSMAGLHDKVLEEIMDMLTRGQSKLQIVPIVGMGGIGKTTLVKNVYEHPLTAHHFDIHGWATISQQYSVKEILLELLQDQGSRESSSQTSEVELGQRLYQRLYGRRYLIIMDDLWSIEAWDELKRYFPENNCGSGVIITSRLSNLASHVSSACGIEMTFLDEDKSWKLLCKTVFGEDGCPLALEETGKDIAKKCEGLPLSIVVIGGLLAKSEQTQEYWKYIAKNLNSIVNLENNERCLNLLYTSYSHLPVHLKPCFLYMGIFDEDDEIRASELIKLWVAEGFLKPISGKSWEEVAVEYLKALVDRNLIFVDKWTHNGKIKFCKMHDLLRDLCLREAKKNKFLFVTRLQSFNNICRDIYTQRRIAIDSRAFWDKDEYYVLDALQSAPLVRSLRFVPMNIFSSPTFRLLRVLRAIQIYDISLTIQRVNLRYIAVYHSSMTVLPCKISSSIYLLWNLQSLTINGHTSTINIWKMPLLRCVKLWGSELTFPREDDFVLENLQTLSGIKDFECGEVVFKRIPNIKKLKIKYEEELPASRFCLSNLEHLCKLEDLNCGFSNFMIKPIRNDLVQNLTFPLSLRKLTLQGCNLHWGDMSTKIGSLPQLQILKLGLQSFIGPEWETVKGQFISLKFLKISCEELECWTTEASHFPHLEHLILDKLWNLKEIPLDLGNIPTLKVIELDNCSNDAVVCAKAIANEQEDFGNQELQFRVLYHWRMRYEELDKMESDNFLII